jgi:hypothetical protein
VEVLSVARADPPPAGTAAFAIDTPRAGERQRGPGIEINGWVIGQDAPVTAVSLSRDNRLESTARLDIRRPDVSADYPAIPHAARSGFTLWAGGESASDEWRVAVDALLESGDAVQLAAIHCRSTVAPIEAAPGDRAVAAPDFVIIGAQRGGTTSLYAYLCAHPQVAPATTKELHFLTDRFHRGPDWYHAQFPATLPPGAITGEATPYALFHPHAPSRLRAVAPAAKAIALLRNPVDRAYSHYQLERSRGDEPLSFADALAAEPARLTGEEAKLSSDPSYVSDLHKHFSYVARGEYAPQLARWLAAFPRHQLLVVRSEDLYAQPAATFGRVAAFLGIDPHLPGDFRVHNRSSGPPLDPALRARLADHFARCNTDLQAMLGWDPPWE